MIDFYKKVIEIQQSLKAPKSQYNAFGKYHYRSCEDIVDGFKKLNTGLLLLVGDEVVNVGDRFYIKSTATLTDGENTITNSALAREALTKKGMDESQITGTASSYARKYALNGLFCIDDTKDSDSMDNSQQQGFTIDDIATSWINACRIDAGVLEQIDDPKYRDFIKGKL